MVNLLGVAHRQIIAEAKHTFLPRLNMASQASIMMGGKRYLSGWIAFDQAQWRAHYGEQWANVVALKRKFDPARVLNPGFIKYE